MIGEWRREPYLISTDPARLDLDVVHGFLKDCYWAAGIPREVVARSIQNSLSFGLYTPDRQIGFARVVTDFATFGYLGDVFILEPFCGRGLGTWLMEAVFSHPDLQRFRRWVLLTRDAHDLYRKSGFTALHYPDRYMERWTADIYKRAASEEV